MSQESRQKFFIGGIIVLLGVLGLYSFLAHSRKDGKKQIVIQDADLHAEQLAAPQNYDEHTENISEDVKKFTHPYRGFSLMVPRELEIHRFEESHGETIRFQQRGDRPSFDPEQKLGFQIYITEFGEEEKFTLKKIYEDLPLVSIEEPKEVVLPDGIHAIVFWSKDPNIGRTREVWFEYEGYLYEATTYAHLDEWLAEVMDSFKFE